MFIACQADDDLPHILSYISEDHLVIGTDYGHADNATDLPIGRKAGVSVC